MQAVDFLISLCYRDLSLLEEELYAGWKIEIVMTTFGTVVISNTVFVGKVGPFVEKVGNFQNL